MNQIEKDASIRVSGILQAIIARGENPDQWEEQLKQALKLHHSYTHKIIQKRTKSK